jgi:hypothetical protein
MTEIRIFSKLRSAKVRLSKKSCMNESRLSQKLCADKVNCFKEACGVKLRLFRKRRIYEVRLFRKICATESCSFPKDCAHEIHKARKRCLSEVRLFRKRYRLSRAPEIHRFVCIRYGNLFLLFCYGSLFGIAMRYLLKLRENISGKIIILVGHFLFPNRRPELRYSSVFSRYFPISLHLSVRASFLRIPILFPAMKNTLPIVECRKPATINRTLFPFHEKPQKKNRHHTAGFPRFSQPPGRPASFFPVISLPY